MGATMGAGVTGQPHVVILGGGFAGMGAVQKLGDAEVRITLIDRNDYHTFQPLLYQVATAELGPEEVAYPLRELQRRHHHLTLHQDDVVKIDLPNKKVTTRALGDVDYDYLVIALGSVVNYFGTAGAADHAFPLYTMPDALRVKNHLLKLFEAVDKQPSLAEDGTLNICIVGGGPTGVEMAGALADLIFVEFRKDYPAVPIDSAQVLLYEHAPTLLRMFKPELQAYAAEELTQRGVKVHTGCGVTNISADSITLASGEVVKTQTLIWAAGLEANSGHDDTGRRAGARRPHPRRTRSPGERLSRRVCRGRYRGDDRWQDRRGAPGPRRNGAAGGQACRHRH